MVLPPVVLASASPRRRRLLERLGIPVEVRPADIDEQQATGPAEKRVLALARGKAERVAAGLQAGHVLAADTLGALDGDILAKPVGEMDAVRMLWRLADRNHEVHTGVAVLRVEDATIVQRAETVVTTRVLFRPLSLTDIRSYIATGEYEGKAGAYAIQGAGGALIAQIEGSYTNVVGLPVVATQRLLAETGYPIPDVDAAGMDVRPETGATTEG